MNDKRFLSSSVLWASAIIASAITGAPAVLTVVLLPALAASAFLVTAPRPRIAAVCSRRWAESS